MRVTLIHNPGAGKNRPDNSEAELEKLLRRAGHKVRYQSSKEKGWKKALKKRADLVVVAGGDGTVARVARRMAGRDTPIALLPAGTANNIARTLGQIERPYEELIAGWKTARQLRLDVGTAMGPWGERHFVEGVGAGVFADLLAHSEGTKKKSKAIKKKKNAVELGMQRVREEVEKCEPMDIVARLDGEDISGRYLMIEAVNLRYVGPNLHLAPDSTPGDGQFDVILVTEAERARLLYYLQHWQENRERLSVLPTRRGSRLQIEWTGFPLHVDDRLRPTADAEPKEMAGLVEARVDGTGVRFLVPDSRTKDS